MLRDIFPNRWVERNVHGVSMAMPWSHRLPDYAAADPAYAANLVDLAAELARPLGGEPLQVLDIGANIGDSALLILDRTPARVLAVEPDEVFLPFLHHNVGGRQDVVIEASLLLAEPASDRVRSVRVGGTAAFVRDDEAGAEVPSVVVGELRGRHPEFDRLRLVKSDTDGYDVGLIPAVARAWPEARPVLFFEYDEQLTRRVGLDPRTVWAELAALGYDACAIWDNGGHPLHRVDLAAVPRLVETDYPTDRRSFWDVAVAHRDDADGRRALDALLAPLGPPA